MTKQNSSDANKMETSGNYDQKTIRGQLLLFLVNYSCNNAVITN